ncbi:MAG: 3-oxoacyl-ACP synthase III [Planctomycetaceae bacterium]|jgi:3-oxoacyl-[acyl-carrier-protein] synthase-3|nr:3-oxoacyl-ACP synthase III [Planctomycetaceae bacterium]
MYGAEPSAGFKNDDATNRNFSPTPNRMRYSNVCIEAFTCCLPEEIVSSEVLEKRCEPLYHRLNLPEGRLEALTGIRERRIWETGKTPGQQSILTVQKLLEQTQFNPNKIGSLIHGSVCRDYLEPATACSVHRALNLPSSGFVYDISNACLGIVSGMIQIADMIELGHIEAGIVVGTESSRSLMETTIQHLNTDLSLTRKSVKSAFASLTIGSGSAAVLLAHRNISQTGNRLLGGAVHAETKFCDLCRSETDQFGGDAMSPLMQTDSEALMKEGVAAAAQCFERFLSETGWTRDDIDRTFCHQVGRAHQKLLFEALDLPPELNFSTLEYLGNTGSAALPTAAAIGIETGSIPNGSQLALLGIGSGINVVMLGIEWQQTVSKPRLSLRYTSGT